ncbi:N-acetyltransferase 8-like 2 [Brachyhypopomus gauderio]|uniref:N-acetyltransferase 8-like 2 n=1 Tax=Brachyhypopomus gauderio TaxID=698409 RepID=UPI0040420EEE
MHIVIRKFKPSDHEAVSTIFQDGIQEHIWPTFTRAMSQPLHVFITLCFFTMGYVLGGESILLSLTAGGSWIGLLFYCCYEFYAGFVRLKLRTDMRDITGYFLSDPDDCFWVAEAEVNGRPQVMGMVAVKAKKDGSGQKIGELFRMIVSSACRRMGLGSRLCKTAEDFCKDQGFAKIVLATSSTQTSAVALYIKMGYTHVQTDTESEVSSWMMRMIRVTILKMEKIL